jgi:hypothetical protein
MLSCPKKNDSTVFTINCWFFKSLAPAAAWMTAMLLHWTLPAALRLETRQQRGVLGQRSWVPGKVHTGVEKMETSPNPILGKIVDRRMFKFKERFFNT